MRGAVILAAWLPLAGTAAAQSRPVVAELFTSEGCSSCPPADALLAEIARTRPDVLPLAFHVTYWNNLGWPDPFSLPAATARQREYATWLGLDGLYTPQLVVDGRRDVVGSDRAGVAAAVRAAERDAAAAVPLTVTRDAAGVQVRAGAGGGRGEVLLIGFDPLHRTRVGRGENAGRTLAEANIVRSLQVLGRWDGTPLALAGPAPAGERVAVLLQAADGRVLGAAVAP